MRVREFFDSPLAQQSVINFVFPDPRGGEVVRVVGCAPCVVYNTLSAKRGWRSSQHSAARSDFLNEYDGAEFKELGVMGDSVWVRLGPFLRAEADLALDDEERGLLISITSDERARFKEVLSWVAFYLGRREARLAEA